MRILSQPILENRERHKDRMRTISLSEFKKTCLAVIDEVNSTRAPVLITKRGKPFARLVAAGRPEIFIGRLKGKLKIVGDIESPAGVWESALPTNGPKEVRSYGRDLKRINRAARRLNSEAADVLIIRRRTTNAGGGARATLNRNIPAPDA